MLNTSDSMVLRVEERSLLRLRGATPRRRRRTPGFSDLALIFGAHGFPKPQLQLMSRNEKFEKLCSEMHLTFLVSMFQHQNAVWSQL